MKLKQWRKQNKLSRAKFAKKVGCCIATIQNYEEGKTKPTGAILKAILKLTKNEVEF